MSKRSSKPAVEAAKETAKETAQVVVAEDKLELVQPEKEQQSGVDAIASIVNAEIIKGILAEEAVKVEADEEKKAELEAADAAAEEEEVVVQESALTREVAAHIAAMEAKKYFSSFFQRGNRFTLKYRGQVIFAVQNASYMPTAELGGVQVYGTLYPYAGLEIQTQ